MAIAVGVTTGGAYVIGGFARAAVEHAEIQRLASAAAHGYSESALESAAADSSALAIAREHDPYATHDHDDRLAAFVQRLEARHDAPAPAPAPVSAALFTRASYTSALPVIPARPFELRGALDESRDLECLTQAVYYEARGEGEAGQAAVAQVVLNRTRHPAFPKTVCGVVFQGAADGGCQFSFACDGSVHRRVEAYAWRQSERVAARALDGFVMAEVGNATHFHVASMTTNWGPGLLRVAQIGAHVFYRFGGHGGSPAAFTGVPTPSDPAPPAPVLASLALAPLASSVANSVANSVAGAAQMVMGQTKPAETAAAAKPADPVKPAAVAAPAAPAAAASAPPVATQAAQPASAPLTKTEEPNTIS